MRNLRYRRFLSAFLAAAMVCGGLPSMAYAAGTNNNDSVEETSQSTNSGLSDNELSLQSILTDQEKVEADSDSLILNGIEEVRGNLYLPLKGENGSTISCNSSDSSVITDEEDEDGRAAGMVTRPAKDTDILLTATITSGKVTASKEFTAHVIAKVEIADTTHYLFAHFTGEGYSNGEQIYFADSEDGLNWSALNNGEPVIESSLGEKGLRDPFIIRSPEGDKFYLIATDLKIYGGNGWTAAQTSGSQSIMVWESTDLVNWSDQRMVKVAADNAGCTWAPEAVYDEDSGEYRRGDRVPVPYNRREHRSGCQSDHTVTGSNKRSLLSSGIQTPHCL